MCEVVLILLQLHVDEELVGLRIMVRYTSFCMVTHSSLLCYNVLAGCAVITAIPV